MSHAMLATSLTLLQARLHWVPTIFKIWQYPLLTRLVPCFFLLPSIITIRNLHFANLRGSHLPRLSIRSSSPSFSVHCSFLYHFLSRITHPYKSKTPVLFADYTRFIKQFTFFNISLSPSSNSLPKPSNQPSSATTKLDLNFLPSHSKCVPHPSSLLPLPLWQVRTHTTAMTMSPIPPRL